MSVTPATGSSSGYGSGRAAMLALKNMRVPAKGATPVSADELQRQSGEHVHSIMTACLSSCSLGTGIGYASIAVHQIRSEGYFTAETYLFTSLLPLLAICGALASWVLLNTLGSRRTLIVISFGFIASWMAIMIATQNITLYVGRVVGGFCSGVVSVCVPLYVTEISPARRRIFLGSSVQIATSLGVLIPFMVSPAMHWRWIAGVCMLPAIIMLSFTSSLVESPQWLLDKGLRAEADKSLLTLYGPEFLAEFDYRCMQPPVEPEQKSNAPAVTAPRKVAICLALYMLQVATCADLVLFYTVQIIGASPDVPLDLCCVIVAVLHFSATFFAVVLTVDIGRGRMLVMSAAIIAVGTITFGILSHLRYGFEGKTTDEKGGWSTFFAVCCIVLGHSVGLEQTIVSDR
ncbi:facilitated trehalose transporter Tret1-like isoform X2 [Ornithodoros turicata]|uniref:facilitated trehalose transporter Tret1-like isoform X2 n=1 Tax=Ornithodoros turicata TaxID=34597 RepID=UPI00313A115D